MRAVVFDELGGPDVLYLKEVGRPSPRGNEILIKSECIGVNPTEILSRTGQRNHNLPRIPGADVSGVVESIGSEVTEYCVGDRVCATGLQNDRQGSYAEYVPVHVNRAAPLPNDVSFEEGAAVGVVGTTSWIGLFKHATLTPTSTCLIHGGSGGVGHFAIQLASIAGSTVVSTAGSDSAKEFTKIIGADVSLDYNDPTLEDSIIDAVGHVDVVVDHMIDEYIMLDLNVLSNNGIILGIGTPYADMHMKSIQPAMVKDANIKMFSVSNESHLGDVLREVLTLLEMDRIELHIGRRYEIQEAPEAQYAISNEKFVGKAILKP